MSNPERRPVTERLSGLGGRPAFVGDFAGSGPVEKVDDRVLVSRKDIEEAEAFLRGGATTPQAVSDGPMVFKEEVVRTYSIDPRYAAALGGRSVQDLFVDDGRGLLQRFEGQPQDMPTSYDELEDYHHRPTSGVIHLGSATDTSYIPRGEQLSLTAGLVEKATYPQSSPKADVIGSGIVDEAPATSGARVEKDKIKMLASRPAKLAYAVIALSVAMGPRTVSALWEASQAAGQDRAGFSVERIVEVKDAFMDGK